VPFTLKPGSTLVDELNRLANGGANYRTINNYVDEALAARQWAAQRSVTLSHTDTVGVLNDIAGITQNHLDYAGVCNRLAGTTGLTANAALQRVQS
jgi:CDP-diacylglycerol pyrophosphatase